MARKRHPKKDVEAAVAYAEERGWTVHPRAGKGHAWARLICAQHDREGCQISVWSTPKSAANHARALKRAVDRCPHETEED